MNFCMMSFLLSPMLPQEIVRATNALRMKGIDWIGLHNSEPEFLGKIARDSGLEIASHTTLRLPVHTLHPECMEELKAAIEDTVKIGAKILMIPPFAAIGQSSISDGTRRWCDFLAEGVPLARDAGITLTVEGTGTLFSPLASTEEFRKALDMAPGLKLTFDIGNTETVCDARESYITLKDDIVQFHIKDFKFFDRATPGAVLKRNGKYGGNVLLGKGDVSIGAFLREIDEHGKTLYFDVETQDPTGKIPQEEAIQRGMEYLSSLVAW